jgi:hypothetical protein
VFAGWKLDAPMADSIFTSARALAAPRMQFGAPGEHMPQVPAQGARP